MRRMKLAATMGVAWAAALTLAMGPLSAKAAGTDVMGFIGTTDVLTCSSSGIVSATPTCTGTGIPLVGGSGAYDFTTSGLVCQVVVSEDVSPDATPDAPPPNGCSLTSTGSYINIVCGTGLASGTANVSANADDDDFTASYSIVFVAGLGVLSGTVLSSNGDDFGASLVAVLTLSPTAALPPTGECAAGFNVTGVAMLTS